MHPQAKIWNRINHHSINTTSNLSQHLARHLRGSDTGEPLHLATAWTKKQIYNSFRLHLSCCIKKWTSDKLLRIKYWLLKKRKKNQQTPHGKSLLKLDIHYTFCNTKTPEFNESGLRLCMARHTSYLVSIEELITSSSDANYRKIARTTVMLF